MSIISNISNLTWMQYKSGGKQIASYIAGGVTVAVGFHFLTPGQGSGIEENLHTIYDGLVQVAKGVAGLVAILTPVYTTIRAMHNSSPTMQIKSVANSLSVPTTNSIADRKEIIEAVAKMPEVQGIVAPNVANTIPSEKVVATPSEIPKA